MKRFLILLFAIPFFCFSQLELSEIMKGPDFIGHLPQNIRWEVSGDKICFDKNIENESFTICYDLTSKYFDTLELKPIAFDPEQAAFKLQFQIDNNEISFWDKTTKSKEVLFSSQQNISNLQRGSDENQIYFQLGQDLFEWKLGERTQLTQVTNFINKPIQIEQKESGHLIDQQLELFEYFSQEEIKSGLNGKNKKGLKKTYTGLGDVFSLRIHPQGEFVVLKKHNRAENKETEYMSFVNSDGYTQSRKARPKVSQNEPNQSLGIFCRAKDTLIWVDFSKLSDIRKKPEYLSDSDTLFYTEDRNLFMNNVMFFDEKRAAILDIRSADNKDRWVVLLDLESTVIKELIHEHDEAWIGGPGISSWNMVAGYFDWVEEGKVFIFQSERTGYSHLYSYDLKTNETKQLTTGNFEVRSVTKSSVNHKFYVSCNQTHPGDRNIFILDLKESSFVPVLSKYGAHELSVSPDEKWFAYRFSSSNQPWELYLSRNKKGALPTQITYSTSKSFNAYAWKKPEVIQFKANDDVPIYARVYEPSADKKNGAAVFFVHGAGYLQNAHHFWSGYYREYMFHNLLVDEGYTVLDLDYRASDGYGRDYRTAIYRYMGGRDLDDYMDAKSHVIDHYGIDSNRIGIYGGSYGGFITLMALLTKPDAFACGAALRSVTDWAHYNHEYTSNILNYPETDSLAYRRSSPIYYAENLKKPLLMLHGMEDNNVQFQDVVRLSQRFIELGKKNWELAVFPVEAHGFKEATSWTDEYRRIFELFEKYLN